MKRHLTFSGGHLRNAITRLRYFPLSLCALQVEHAPQYSPHLPTRFLSTKAQGRHDHMPVLTLDMSAIAMTKAIIANGKMVR